MEIFIRNLVINIVRQTIGQLAHGWIRNKFSKNQNVSNSQQTVYKDSPIHDKINKRASGE